MLVPNEVSQLLIRLWLGTKLDLDCLEVKVGLGGKLTSLYAWRDGDFVGRSYIASLGLCPWVSGSYCSLNEGRSQCESAE